MNAIGILIFLLAIVLNAGANVLMKASAVNRVEGLQDQILNPFMIAGLASFGLAFLAYRQVLLRGIPLSIAYPVMTTAGFIIVLAASHFVFHERLDGQQWTGIALLVAGIWLIAGRL
jgi:multidrug transporter EmrE-like cation transporter